MPPVPKPKKKKAEVNREDYQTFNNAEYQPVSAPPIPRNHSPLRQKTLTPRALDDQRAVIHQRLNPTEIEVLIESLLDLITITRQLESAKMDLCCTADFNLMDGFTIFDYQSRSKVTEQVVYDVFLSL